MTNPRLEAACDVVIDYEGTPEQGREFPWCLTHNGPPVNCPEPCKGCGERRVDCLCLMEDHHDRD